MFRLCTHTNRVCNCDDVAMQPCLAAAIEEYLGTLRWNVLTDGVDGGPGDLYSIASSRRDVWAITHSADSLAVLERWLAAHGIGLLRAPGGK